MDKTIHLTNKQKIEFLRRSYTAIDGLWFLKMEEKYGFEAALEIDKEVWASFPKIQVRLLKSMTGKSQGIEALEECYTARLTLEGFTFDVEKSPDGSGFKMVIGRCPWHEIMMKSGREKLSGRIGEVICETECSVWASEFGENIRFESEGRVCKGAPECVLCFRQDK